MHDNSSSEEIFFPARSILRTSTLQENRFDEEHAKHLSMRNIGMFNLDFFFILTIVITFPFVYDIFIYLSSLYHTL
jgi:hypothetical protein